MAQIERYAAGEFSWVDLLTPEIAAARAFYTGVFDWRAGEPAGPEGGGYTQLYCADRVVLGMVGMDQAERTTGMPASWTSYVSVVSADATAARAVELGAKLEMPPLDVFDMGRMALLADPDGARFAIWQPRSHIGATLRDEPVSLCWNELHTQHPERSQEFYAALFAWTFRATPGAAPGGYVEIFNGAKANGGMLPLPPAMPMPSCWVPYFAVSDCDASVRRIRAGGGQIHRPAEDIEPGRFAVASDPQGGLFCVIQLRDPR